MSSPFPGPPSSWVGDAGQGDGTVHGGYSGSLPPLGEGDRGGAAPLLYIIAGPTAVGKTSAAIQLAQALDTEIVSADSRQCYRELSIGVARPAEAELAAVPHHFIATHSVTEDVSAADFEQLAMAKLSEIFQRKNAAVLCGGTGLYIRALAQGLDEMPPVDEEIRQQITAAYEARGLQWLQERLRGEDPQYLEETDVQNPARLLRALIFKRSTGQSIRAFRSRQAKERPFRMVKVCLDLPREQLYARIDARVNRMMEAGLLEEVKSLLHYRHLKNLNTVGYAELFDYSDGKTDRPKAITLIQQHSRNYAKRQLTWFRNEGGYYFLPADAPDLVARMLALVP